MGLEENADHVGRRFPEGRKIQRKDTKLVAGVKKIIAESYRKAINFEPNFAYLAT